MPSSTGWGSITLRIASVNSVVVAKKRSNRASGAALDAAFARRIGAPGPGWCISERRSSSAGLREALFAMSGALPCTADMAQSFPRLAPRRPSSTSPAHRSDTMSRRGSAAGRRTSGVSRAACIPRRRSARRADVGVRPHIRPRAVEEQAVAELHDVRSVDRGHALASVRARVNANSAIRGMPSPCDLQARRRPGPFRARGPSRGPRCSRDDDQVHVPTGPSRPGFVTGRRLAKRPSACSLTLTLVALADRRRDWPLQRPCGA